MSNVATAKRYAKALFEVANEHKAVDAIEKDFSAIVALIKENEELNKLLRNPLVTVEDKKSLVQKISEGANALLVNFLNLLVDKGRESLYAQILEQYLVLANDSKGIANATITSASPLTEEELQKVAERFGKQIGKTIQATNVVDPSILGGLVVRIGTRLYDGSVKGKIDRLHKTLLEK